MTAQLPSRERLETLIRAIECESYDEEEIVSWVNSDEILSMARALLAAHEQEPVAWQWQNHGQWHVTNDEERARDLAWDGVDVLPLYTNPAPSIPAVPDEMEDNGNPHDEEDIAYVGGWNACRAAMLNHFGDSDDMVLIPPNSMGYQSEHVLDMVNSPVIPNGWRKWIGDVIEYLKNGLETDGELETEGSIEAKLLLSAAPPVSDGWIPVSERLPPLKTGVLVATEMDGPGDWRMKWATRVPEHPDAINGWLIPGASWTPSHWHPLPDAPKVKP
ncbi:DUF551 domain-containing protein [Phytobacter diazotrophicus]|uniref:DUF551 domain-containing protein n=1 Tax=Phytobacter diazotrophicus TaxID=395631 RepID=UPI002935C704|nr:DUF551 domain-containing protein [Phytobacter diazotrophicus]MDV2903102.1 DUF551 domain-containing protein [Phytobacter diazotrophicus]